LCAAARAAATSRDQKSVLTVLRVKASMLSIRTSAARAAARAAAHKRKLPEALDTG